VNDNPESVAAANERSNKRRRRWAKVLAVIGAVLLPIAGLTLWSRNQLLNTDRYVDTMKPLAEDPAVRAAIADRVTQAVTAAVDIEDRAKEALPDRAKFLAVPIATAAENLIHEVTVNFLESDQFKQLWNEVNRLAHDQIVAIITGKNTDVLQRENGKVVISLRPIAERVEQRLGEIVPIDLSSVDTRRLNTEFVIVDSKDLGRVQSGVKWFNRGTYILIVLAIAALIGSAILDKDRRRGIQRVGLAITVAMVVTLFGYRAGRSFYISSLPSEVTHPDAATAAFDIITRYVERGIKTLLALGVVMFVVAWTLGPSRLATRLRGWWQQLRARGSAEMSGVEPGPVAAWIAGHRNELRFAVVALAVVVLLLWERPTGRVVLLLTVLTVLVLAFISVLAGAAPSAADGEETADEQTDVTVQ
jgi:hypothetical protein